MYAVLAPWTLISLKMIPNWSALRASSQDRAVEPVNAPRVYVACSLRHASCSMFFLLDCASLHHDTEEKFTSVY